MRALRKWEGPVWDHERPSVVQLRTPEATWEKLAYAMSNPVAAGLVNRAADWPGVTTLPHELGRAEWKCSRPKVFFDPDNPQWPDEVTLPLTIPECLDAEPEQVREVVAEELARCEAQAQELLRAKGWRALGRRAIRKLSPYKRAKSWEALRERNPTFAVGRGQRSAFFEAVAAVRAFRTAYRAALGAWRRGIREAQFPHGTWFMCHFHGAAAAPG